MGLDIGAMSNLRLREDLFRNEDWEVINQHDEIQTGNFYVASVIEDFKDAADGIETGQIFEYDEYLHVRAGSYGGYSRWRQMLCNMALGVEPEVVWEYPENFKQSPFFDMINFSDCEGVIGTETCKSLYQDFLHNLPGAVAYATRLPENFQGEYWLDKYREWMEAFELASKDGCVDFH